MSIHICIVSCNTVDCLLNCLSGLDAEYVAVTVIDNASTDGSVEQVASKYPWVALIRNTDNHGFARAANQGIEAALQARTESILLLNSDTLVKTETLMTLHAFLMDHPSVAAVSPALHLATGAAQPYAFGCDPSLAYLIKRGWNRMLFNRALHDWETHDMQYPDWVSGACMLIRQEALTQVGLLDEQFFMYFEDNDWCLRARQGGWTICYNPSVAITHLGGVSFRRNTTAEGVYQNSLLYFYKKHYPKQLVWLRIFLNMYNLSRKIRK